MFNIKERGQAKTITSIEVAEVTGKRHKHVMNAIRKMEPAWEKVNGFTFTLASYDIAMPNGGKRKAPCYLLNMAEYLYISTKFTDEARARIVKRWSALAQKVASASNPPRPKPHINSCASVTASLL